MSDDSDTDLEVEPDVEPEFEESRGWRVRIGRSVSRANAARPADRDERRFQLYLAVFLMLLGLGPWLPTLLPFMFTAEERAKDASGYQIFGGAAMTIGAFFLLLFILDLLRTMTIGGMTPAQRRRVLAREKKAARYTACPTYLRWTKRAAALLILVNVGIFAWMFWRYFTGGV